MDKHTSCYGSAHEMVCLDLVCEQNYFGCQKLRVYSLSLSNCAMNE